MSGDFLRGRWEFAFGANEGKFCIVQGVFCPYGPVVAAGCGQSGEKNNTVQGKI